MLGVIFQNLPRINGLKNLIECDAPLNHFLVRVFGDANVFKAGLSMYPLQYSL